MAAFLHHVSWHETASQTQCLFGYQVQINYIWKTLPITTEELLNFTVPFTSFNILPVLDQFQNFIRCLYLRTCYLCLSRHIALLLIDIVLELACDKDNIILHYVGYVRAFGMWPQGHAYVETRHMIYARHIMWEPIKLNITWCIHPSVHQIKVHKKQYIYSGMGCMVPTELAIKTTNKISIVPQIIKNDEMSNYISYTPTTGTSCDSFISTSCETLSHEGEGFSTSWLHQHNRNDRHGLPSQYWWSGVHCNRSQYNINCMHHEVSTCMQHWHTVIYRSLIYSFLQISTTGIILLYSYDWDTAVIAPFAANIDLSCPAGPNENLAYYEMTKDPNMFSLATSIVEDETGNFLFNPQSLIIISWQKVQRYNCPEDRKVNFMKICCLHLLW